METRDGGRSLRVSSRIEAGTVWTNAWAQILDQFEEGGFQKVASADSMARAAWLSFNWSSTSIELTTDGRAFVVQPMTDLSSDHPTFPDRGRQHGQRSSDVSLVRTA